MSVERAIKLLRLLVSVESPSGREFNFAMLLRELIEESGHKVTVQRLSSSSCNLIVNPTRKPELAILAHMDTVMPMIPPEVRGTVVCGRGACDVKGGIAALLLALERVDLARVSVVFTGDEEESGSGALLYSLEYSPKTVVVVEPSSLRVANAARGALELLVIVRGEGAHGSIDTDRDAFSRFLELLLTLRRRYRVRVISVHAGSEDLYATPDECRALIDITADDWRSVLNEVSSLLSRLGATWKIVDAASSWEVCGSLLDVFKEILSHHGLPSEPVTYPAWTDATRLAEFGIPALIFGPGELALAHTPRESIDAREVVKCAEVLADVIREVEERGAELEFVRLPRRQT